MKRFELDDPRNGKLNVPLEIIMGQGSIHVDKKGWDPKYVNLTLKHRAVESGPNLCHYLSSSAAWIFVQICVRKNKRLNSWWGPDGSARPAPDHL